MTSENVVSPLLLLVDVETLKDTEIYKIFAEDMDIMDEYFSFEEIEQNCELILESPKFENFKKNFETFLIHKNNYHIQYYIRLFSIFYLTRPKLLFMLPHLFSILLNVFHSKITEYKNILQDDSKHSYFWNNINEIFFKNEKTQIPQTFELFSLEENEENDIFEILFHDDTDRFISYLSKNQSIDINTTIEIPKTHKMHQLIEHFGDNFISYLNICCLFGSTKCFKYLILNNCNITNKTPTFSVAGGSTEIIQILNQRNISFKNPSYFASIIYHRYSLTDWLITNFGFKKFSLPNCAFSFNFKAFIFFLHNFQCFDEIYVNKNTSLHYFCIFGCFSAIKYLFDHGCTKDPPDNNGWTPLHNACLKNQLPMVEFLISNGCDKEAKDQNGNTPLHCSINKGYLHIVKYLIASGCNKESKNYDNYTPLHHACETNHIQIVEYLISQGCNLKCETLSYKTPLHTACEEGFLPIVECLIKHHCYINCQTLYRKTPLHFACEHGFLPIAEFLISQGCKKERKDYYGYTALHFACQNNHLPIVKYLISKQCNINSQTSNGRTPLHIACEYGFLPIVKYLISKDCDKEIKDKNGYTPLHFACYKGYFQIVEYLLSHGCNPKAYDNDGKTPSDIALQRKHIKIMQLFK